MMAHTRAYLFYPPCSCTHNKPHNKKQKVSCLLYAHCTHSILAFFIKFQTGNPVCPWSSRKPHPFSARLLFDETFAQPYTFAVVNCADVALSVFYQWLIAGSTPCFNTLPDIFAVMNCSVLALSAVFCSGLLTWNAYIIIYVLTVTHCTTTSNESACKMICMLCQKTSPKRWLANVNMCHIVTSQTSYISNNDHHTPLLNTRIW